MPAQLLKIDTDQTRVDEVLRRDGAWNNQKSGKTNANYEFYESAEEVAQSCEALGQESSQEVLNVSITVAITTSTTATK